MVDKRQQIATTKAGGIKPLVLGAFTFHETGVAIKGKPSLNETSAAIAFAERAEKASQWWLADLLAYLHTRDDWEDQRDEVIEATGYTPETIRKYLYMGERFAPGRRRPNVDFSVHREVAALEPRVREELLEVAETERMSVRDMRSEVRARSRRRVLEGQAVLEGMYRVIYADPPWAYNDRGDIVVGKSSAYKRAEAHYPTMPIEEICRLPVAEHALPNSVLFLWVTAPMLLQNPGPREVGEAWGFTYKQNLVWDKVLGMFGHYAHGRHEHLTIWTRGAGLPDIDPNWVDSVQTYRRGEHSAKPKEFYSIIEKLYVKGPYLELFARERREGWTSFGNDASLWAQEARA